jgi:lysophospholipase L1-like esterase
MRRRCLTAFLSFVLLLGLPLHVFAGKPVVKPPVPVEYVGLGDSIGAGWSASPGQDFFTLYSAYLSQKAVAAGSPYLSANTALAGLTSTQLRSEISGTTNQTQTRATLPGATIVTVSIGGNNLMHPLLQHVADLYGVSMDDPNFMSVLSAAVNLNPTRLSLDMLGQMLPNSALRNSLANGVSNFNADLPFIINGIKGLASGTKIYFLTVYNPVYGNSTLRSFMDGYIDQINATLKANASGLGYTVVDVAAAFEAYTGSVPLVGFNMAATPATYDPHPTDAGHKMIADLLIAASTTIRKGRK